MVARRANGSNRATSGDIVISVRAAFMSLSAGSGGLFTNGFGASLRDGERIAGHSLSKVGDCDRRRLRDDVHLGFGCELGAACAILEVAGVVLCAVVAGVALKVEVVQSYWS